MCQPSERLPWRWFPSIPKTEDLFWKDPPKMSLKNWFALPAKQPFPFLSCYSLFLILFFSFSLLRFCVRFLFCLFCWPLIPLIVRSQTSKKTMNVKIAGSKGSGCLPHIPFPLCPLFGSFPSSLSFLAFHHFHFFCLLFLFFPFVSRFVKVKWTRHQRKRKTCCCLRRAATKKNIVCV